MTSEEYVIEQLIKKTEAVEELSMELRRAENEVVLLKKECEKLLEIVRESFKLKDGYFSAYVHNSDRLYWRLCDALGIEIAKEAE